ncbi:MAG TPA: heparan-alpha-glucosaminide N-acetyltransferase domain-containing protein [Terriglobales bacterium]|nr:heparan-alpha-glucosaminide N-acetyltransferase domain-containing protein [Terriglobales bacterium]
MVSAENAAASQAAELSKPATRQGRLQSVDALRGAVMILMALDHTRDFVSRAAMSFQPTDLARTTTALFFTRWVTHFCAPVFAFTAGLGAFLWLRRDRTRGQLSRFLITRGLWLMFLELTVLRGILFLDVGWSDRLVLLAVIWMLGLSMVVLAGLIHLPPRWLLPLSLLVIASHNLFDSVDPARFGRAAWIWDILHVLQPFPVHGALVMAAYPLVPWFAVMAAGYCVGPVLRWERERRQRFLIRLGLGLSFLFVVLRAWNRYGDPVPWSSQHSTLFTMLSFLNCTKYPPSLAFLLMTLGPAMIALAWLERIRFSENHPLMVFGRVPFFYYILHLAVIHASAIFLNYLRYGWTNFLLLAAPSLGGPRQEFPPDYGFELWVVYAVWIAVVVFLYPVCRWYAGLKRQRTDWWLSYL